MKQTHGHAKKNKLTGTYHTWRGIKSRCLNPNSGKYPIYGGRGIKMYEPWVNDYQSFYDYIGDKPSSEHSIGRIDNDGNYEPGNIRWETLDQQANNKSMNQVVEYGGVSKTIAQWAVHFNLNYHALYSRLMTLELSMDEAVKKGDRRYSSVKKKTPTTSKAIRCDTLGINFRDLVEASNVLGVGQELIRNQVKGRRLHADGLSFRYI